MRARNNHLPDIEAVAERAVRAAGHTVGALTHRSVARAAGVPLARVSYHYPRVDDLLVAAATQ